MNKYTVLTAIYCIMIFILSSMDLRFISTIEEGKIGFRINSFYKHMVEYAILGVLSFKSSRNISFSILYSSWYGVTDEIHQWFVPRRMLSPYDITANIIGGLIGSILLLPLSSHGKQNDKRKFTITCPIHNEEKLIPYTISSIYDLNPDEIIFIMDRCTDKSLQMIKKFDSKLNKNSKIKIFNVTEETDFYVRPGYLMRNYGYKYAENNIILNTAADIYLDPEIPKYLKYIDTKTKIINFGFLDYPFNIRCFLRQVYSKITPWKSMSGIYFIDKKAWIETENQETAKIYLSEDSHLIKSITKKYDLKYVNTRSIHLRTNETAKMQKYKGKSYNQIGIKPLRAFLTALFMLRPHFFATYWQSRKQPSKDFIYVEKKDKVGSANESVF